MLKKINIFSTSGGENSKSWCLFVAVLGRVGGEVFGEETFFWDDYNGYFVSRGVGICFFIDDFVRFLYCKV